ncbi:MAG: orotidine-5'-phosphate decarboxylase [Turneriella sp.]|nr:orotidine-5'-phosphate decarboxylase [Turneriella sp.]
MSPREKMIVALDVPDAPKALQLVETLDDLIVYYKVGMQLYFREGNPFIHELLRRGKKVFLDLKIHDIPQTVAGAVASLASLAIEYLTLATGEAQLRAARQVLQAQSSPLKLLNVTVLTSEKSSLAEVLARTELSLRAGADGVIASGQETQELRKRFGQEFIIITPGIRPHGSAVHDQERVATPRAAIAAGATHIVVGRPITQAVDPRSAAFAILQEINECHENFDR